MDVETVQFEQNKEDGNGNLKFDNNMVYNSATFVEDSFIAETSDGGSESGLGQDYAEWVFDDAEEQTTAEEGLLFDLSNEQALATLKYFSKLYIALILLIKRKQDVLQEMETFQDTDQCGFHFR